MSSSIIINGLTLVHAKSGGRVTSTIPDICLTPAGSSIVPIPYTNTAFSKDLKKGTDTIFADGSLTAATKASEFYKSIGDEAGTKKGIKSGTIKDKATWVSWSPNVFLEGKNACRLSDKMLLNKGNSASLGGEQQPNLSNTNELIEFLCEIACECFNAKKFQNCVAKKIKQKAKDGLQAEKSYQRENGKWRKVETKTGDHSGRRNIAGSRRPDITTTKDGKVDKIVEMKFPKDSYGDGQERDYRQIAKDLGAKFKDLDVNDCECWKKKAREEERKKEPKKNPQPQTAQSSKWVIGGLLVVAVAATVCPFDGPTGDVVAWGAFAAAAGL